LIFLSKDILLGHTALAAMPAVLLAALASGQARPQTGSLPVAPSPTQRAMPERETHRFVVVLDAAHGGDDGGAQLTGGTLEKTLTLTLSVRLRSLLTARGFQVVTTREGNLGLDGNARAQMANHANAAACLSLHASETGSGVHIFVSSLAPRAPGRFLAWKTAQSAFVARSLKLAGTVNSALEHTSVPGATDTGAIPATLGRASLLGVDSMACPAVVLEAAPIRGADGKVVTDVSDPQYQTQIVEALAAAMLEWRTDWETESGHSGGRLP
jgi:N-acetylmuramoyl-L-alanine amidase